MRYLICLFVFLFVSCGTPAAEPEAPLIAVEDIWPGDIRPLGGPIEDENWRFPPIEFSPGVVASWFYVHSGDGERNLLLSFDITVVGEYGLIVFNGDEEIGGAMLTTDKFGHIEVPLKVDAGISYTLALMYQLPQPDSEIPEATFEAFFWDE